MSFIKKIFLIIFSILIGLTICELFLNVYGKYNNLSKQELILSNAIYEKPKSSILNNEHPDLKIIVKNRYDTSGVRNHDKINTEEKKNIIGIFGDSHVENINIKNEFEFTKLLDNFLEDFNVVNYGVGGYSIDQIFIRYLSFKKHDIKHVYYIFSVNDAGSISDNNLISFDENNYKILTPEFRLFEKVIGRLNLTYFIIDLFYNLRAKIYTKHNKIDISNYPKKLAEKLYYKNLRDNFKSDNSKNLLYFNKILDLFKKEVIKNNAGFSIVVLPKKSENDGFINMVQNKDDYDVINLYENNDELLKNLDQNLIFQNDSHFNEYGNLMIFQLLKRDLLKQNEEEFLFLEDIKRKIDKLYN